MNEFLLAREKCMSETHLNLDLHIVLVDHLQRTKKESKNLQKQEIRDILHARIYDF